MTGTTEAEGSFLASLKRSGITAERGRKIVDWSSVRCGRCGNEFAVEGGEATIIGPLDPLPSSKCPIYRTKVDVKVDGLLECLGMQFEHKP